ncbi:hypothetical protein HHI36_008770 [Cryptolaemus montrouzieri]|uniref:Uncharacterized protein n=1 Tax=Cryptolaemus montrouzieri TaxID=559131 RepID=A0ABD2MTX3_9CUCU
MGSSLLICQRCKLGLSSVKRLATLKGTIVTNTRCYDSGRCNCDCPQRDTPKKDPKDTAEECEETKKMIDNMYVEKSCRINEWNCNRHNTTICDPMECKVERIEDHPIIAKEVFEQERPCIPFEDEGLAYRNMCEIGELRKCYARDPLKAHHCYSQTPICYSYEKAYPMRHAGTKPIIDGRPKCGHAWRKRKWGLKC